MRKQFAHFLTWDAPQAPPAPDYAILLEAFWREGLSEAALAQTGFSNVELDALRDARTAAERQTGGSVRLELVESIFHALPPVVVYCADGLVWNRQFGAELAVESSLNERNSLHVPGAPLERLRTIVDRARQIGRTMIMLPFGKHVHRVQAVAAEGATVLYLRPVGATALDLDPTIRLAVVLRASGVQSKEIAYLLDVSTHHVEYLSKTHRALIKSVQLDLCRAKLR